MVTSRVKVKTSISTPEISSTKSAKADLVPSKAQFEARKMRYRGAMSFWSVHPPANEPLAPAEGRVGCVDIGGWGYVVQISIADLGLGVSLEHRIDGFGELGAAGLVNAAGIDPYPVMTVSVRDATGLPDLDRYKGVGKGNATRDEGLDIAKRLLGILPDMRQDCVAARDGVRVVEVDEPEVLC